MKDRPIYQQLWDELKQEKAMVFVSGPRQAGKTTLAKMISRDYTNSLYVNWDILDHRTQLLQNPYFFRELPRKDTGRPLIIFDEIHKYRDWKNYLKGVYDKFHSEFDFLISGSGRLDAYQYTGDSMAGRYAHFRLWPFTLGELTGQSPDPGEIFHNPYELRDSTPEILETWNRIRMFSGFPEPYLYGNKRSYRRWSQTYTRQIIREDIRDMAAIRAIHEVETLYALILEGIGSPTSIPSLAGTLKSAYNTIRSRLDLFERLYLTFSITPWHKRIARAVHKEKKTYCWDIPRIKNPGARFENMVAGELFRAASFRTDSGYGDYSVHYVKNKEQLEVDFLVTRDDEPVILIEAKTGESVPSTALRKFQEQLKIPAIQLTDQQDTFRLFDNGEMRIMSAPAAMWLSRL